MPISLFPLCFCASNSPQVLIYLHKHRSEGATAAAIDSAAHNGHLRVVAWFTKTIPALGATTAAMDGAACAGHLEIVKFLHAHRSEGCTTEAMDSAARRGHLEVCLADVLLLLSLLLPPLLLFFPVTYRILPPYRRDLPPLGRLKAL